MVLNFKRKKLIKSIRRRKNLTKYLKKIYKYLITSHLNLFIKNTTQGNKYVIQKRNIQIKLINFVLHEFFI